MKAFSPISIDDRSKAAIYVYRPKAMTNALYSPDLYIDDELKFPVKNGRYSRLSLSAGSYPLKRDSGVDLIHPDDLPMVEKRYLRRLNGEGSSLPFSFRVLRRDGEFVWVETNTVKTMWEGTPATLSFIRDVTERKRAEEALRESEKRLKAILENIQAGVVVVEPETHTIVDVNPVALSMIGAPREHVVGTICQRYFGLPEQEQGRIAELETGARNVEQMLLTAHGERLPILKSVVSVTLGGRAHLLESFLDISELKDAQAQLARAKESAEMYSQELMQALELSESLRRQMGEAKEQVEEADRAKSEFLASMSHELRVPLTTVIGIADLLWESPLNFEQKRFVEAIRASSENLLQLISDILDLSKVEAGQIELEETSLNLTEVVKNTCEAHAFEAHRKNLELVWWIGPEVETRLFGDPVRLGQVLSNLIGNAVKFTKNGEVCVEVRRQAIRDLPAPEDMRARDQEVVSTVELLFSVIDTGIGIPPEKMKTIFDWFSQADSSITREYGGTGLGLAISRRLAECMGGRMWAESEVERGSTFCFTARFEAQPKKASLQIPEADLRDVKILIIDDNATNRTVISEMLTQWGAVVTERENGERGLDEMRRASYSGEPYALVLLDCRMPKLDGFQVAEFIREDPLLSSPVIMMLTSDTRKAGIKRSQALGITDYLLKPIRWSDLKEAVMAALGRKEAIARERSAAAVPEAEEDLRPLHILLAEDNEKNRELIQAFLKKTPHTLDAADNGEKALEKFTTGRYDLVLMDIQMPGMDGYTATREIRKWEEKNRREATPIIALSAYALVEHVRKSLEAGCTIHLTKPIKKADLLATIRKYTLDGESQDASIHPSL